MVRKTSYDVSFKVKAELEALKGHKTPDKCYSVSRDKLKNDELQELQHKLQHHIKLFDSLIKSDEQHNLMPIRLIRCYENSIANEVAEYLMNNGFFTSAVFFPIVPQGRAAIRVTLRADMTESSPRLFSQLVKARLSEYDLVV